MDYNDLIELIFLGIIMLILYDSFELDDEIDTKEVNVEEINSNLDDLRILYEDQKFYNIFEDSCIDETYLFSKGIEFFFTEYVFWDITYTFFVVSFLFLFLLFVSLFSRLFIFFKLETTLFSMLTLCCFSNFIFIFKFNFIISVCITFFIYFMTFIFLFHNWSYFYLSKKKWFLIWLILTCSIIATLLMLYSIIFSLL